MTDEQILDVAKQLPISFSDVKAIHDYLPAKIRTADVLLSICKTGYSGSEILLALYSMRDKVPYLHDQLDQYTPPTPSDMLGLISARSKNLGRRAFLSTTPAAFHHSGINSLITIKKTSAVGFTQAELYNPKGMPSWATIVKDPTIPAFQDGLIERVFKEAAIKHESELKAAGLTPGDVNTNIRLKDNGNFVIESIPKIKTLKL